MEINFAKFLNFFEEELNFAIQKNNKINTESFDNNISMLASLDAGKLKQALQNATFKTIGSYIPESRLGDEIYAYANFVLKHHRSPKNIPRFNDVLYYIKTTDEISDPLRVFVSDKEFLKIYVRATIGDEYNVPTIDVIRDESHIDKYLFPDSCVIKPTHSSGLYLILKNGDFFDRSEIKKWFHANYYLKTREANYRTLKPKVIIEPIVFDNSDIEDFKIFCMNGVPKFISVMFDRRTKTKSAIFDIDWKPLGFSWLFPYSNKKIDRPANLKEMLDAARELSKGFGFIRIDLYSNGESFLVGEITNCPGGANGKFFPPESELIASKMMFF